MIFYENLYSIIECIYLEEVLGENMSACDVYVNPEQVTYLINKNVVINDFNYPLDKLKKLEVNGCRIISRVPITDSINYTYSPYIIRPNFNIMWNGDKVMLDQIEEVLDYCSFDQSRNLLLFPKIISNGGILTEKEGIINCIGWALHQVGLNQVDCNFLDLDIIKTKKMHLQNQ